MQRGIWKRGKSFGTSGIAPRRTHSFTLHLASQRPKLPIRVHSILFHHENLYYVDETTRKLVPLDAYDKEAEEWAKSPDAYINIDVTECESNIGGKKKQQKKEKE